MSNVLEQLRQKNPGLKLYSVEDPEFEKYGRILHMDTTDLAVEFDKTEVPATGNTYVASDSRLEKLSIADEVYSSVFGYMDIEVGYCNGNGNMLNALEYHKCSEVNYSTTGLVLLLALPEDLKDGRINSEDVVGFYLPKNVLVEILPLVYHFAPCKINEAGFKCLVILERGTNEPLTSVDTKAPGEKKMIWMRNKWLVCHPDSPQAEKGAYIGIDGVNIQLIS